MIGGNHPDLWDQLDKAIERWEQQWGTYMLDAERASLITETIVALKALGFVWE